VVFWRSRVRTGNAAEVTGDEPRDESGTEHVRSWTVAEANGALPWVAEVVARAQEQWEAYRSHATTRARLVRQNGHGLVPADPASIQSCIDELATEGIVLRDIGRGLIDFPAQAPSGRWYWLCWLAGEDAVTWWHWPEDGFGGRTPLDTPPT
jgi:hypothetical protein